MSIQLAVSPAGNIEAPYGHFQVVGPDGFEIEVQPSEVGSGLGGGHWQITVQDHDGGSFLFSNTYGIRDGVIEPGRYSSMALPSSDGQSEAQQWELLSNIASAIGNVQQNIQYHNTPILDENGERIVDENNFPLVAESGTQNSNTFISTLLYVIGIDLADYVPTIFEDLTDVESVPGYTHNVLLDPLSGVPISLTLSGTDGNDFIRTGNGNDTLNGGLGDDTILAAGGNDLVQGNLGNDVLDGGADTDTLTYESLTSGVHISLDQATTGDLDSNFTATGAGPSGDWTDHFTNFENLNLTSFDDVVSVSRSNLADLSIDAGDNLEAGDTVDFSGLESNGGIIFDLGTGDLEVGGEGNHLDLDNFENVVGSSSDDTIEGSASNNIIYGGGGADSLSGGAGDDIIIFDAEDTLVDGGEGRDVGIVSGEAGVSVDLTATGLEVVVGGAGADTFTLDGLGETIQMAAGGAGIDTFTISTGTYPSSSGPVVVWGGEGADIFNINGDSYYSNGILTVNVEGLTADNFADFDLSLLGLGNGFDWDAIDMVVLNPDSEDRFFQNGEAIGVGGQRSIFVDTYSYSGPYDDEGTLVVVGSISANYLSEYDASFLGGSIASIQTLTEFYSYGAVVGIDTDTGEPYELDPLSPRDVYFIDTNDLYTAANANFTSQQTAWDHTDESETEPFEFEQLFYFWVGTRDMDYDTLDDIGSSWFVAGGTFGNLDLSTNGSISVTMPEGSTGFSVTNWLASLTSGGTGGAGGTGANSNTTNASSGSGTTTVSTFTTGTSFITFDGAAIDPTSTSGGYTLAQAGANVQVDFGGGDVVILENITLTEWRAAAATQFFGSATDETLTGTSQDEAFTSGTGNDLIIANGGDDTINYVSGDDVIRGHKSNYGNDTLNLSQYTADQVSFRIVGHDVFIDTPDGTIELDYQVRYELGHARSNIENIVFSDGTLDDAAIRDRAIADQTSAGDDIITGSYQTDTISSGAGNDTIYAGSGDDTIIYTSGDDVVIGNNTGYNYGNDTLDLSQYTADQVSFRIAQHDVFIDTPNGTIELDYQVRNELGDARLNIESIVFSDGTLDEAGIAARAIADQVSSGNDVITGSYQSEVITGGAGNDTLSGVSGSDTFAFTAGDGVDQITDYDAANDVLEFTGISFIDLTVTQTGNDVLIEYGTGDQVTVAGALVADFVETEFLFA